MTNPDPDSAGNSSDPIHVEFQYDEDTPTSIAIVRAIAVIEDVDPMDSPRALGVTLFDHLDPEALDRLVTAAGDASGMVIDLTICNDHQYAVEIRDTGDLVVEKAV